MTKRKALYKCILLLLFTRSVFGYESFNRSTQQPTVKEVSFEEVHHAILGAVYMEFDGGIS